MPYRTYDIIPGQSSSNYQSSSDYQSSSYRQPSFYSQANSYSQATSYGRPNPHTQPTSYTQQSSQAYNTSYAQPSGTVRYVSSTRPTRTALPSQPEYRTRSIGSIDRRRFSDDDDEALMIRRQRRVDEISDNLPIRTTRRYPQAAQNLYRQDLAFNHTAGCRQYDGRFHCHCGYSTSQQYKSISHATSAHNAPTPYVCPACGVCCPRGLYQYNAHLQEYHPELVQHAALQYRDDRFVRRNGSYYN
ncbi:hypothetical protein KCU91_g4509, partial [Aureobasidium melanogenum]